MTEIVNLHSLKPADSFRVILFLHYMWLLRPWCRCPHFKWCATVSCMVWTQWSEQFDKYIWCVEYGLPSCHAANHRLNGNLGQYKCSWLLHRALKMAGKMTPTLCYGTDHALNYWDQCKLMVWRTMRVQKSKKKGAAVKLEMTEREGGIIRLKEGAKIWYLNLFCFF